MRNRLVRTFSLLAALMLALALPAAAQDTGGLAGTVRDAATGRPMAGVRVEAVAEGRVVATTTTDAQGAYRFTGLRPGHYSVVVGGEAGGATSMDPNVGAGQTGKASDISPAV